MLSICLVNANLFDVVEQMKRLGTQARGQLNTNSLC